MPHLQVSPDATAVEVDATRTSPDMDALTPAERQALYESVVQEMIRVRHAVHTMRLLSCQHDRVAVAPVARPCKQAWAFM